MNSIQEKPEISIIIPCYNAEAFIELAIKSVLGQPYTNWELIIINDGSTDRTESICREYETDSRILVESIPNGGTGHARNIGMKKARGKWVLFLDADDLFLPDSITFQLIEKLQQYYDKKIDIILTSSVKTDMALTKIMRYFSAEKEFNHIPNREFWSWIYNRDYLIDKNICFFEYSEQDIETAFRYRAVSNTDKIIADQSIVFYLQRDNKSSNQNTWNETTLHYVKALVYRELFEQCEKDQDRLWLYDVMLTEVRLFYQNCSTEKCKKKAYIRIINKLFREIEQGLPTAGIRRLSIKTSIKYRFLMAKAILMQKLIKEKIVDRTCSKAMNAHITNEILAQRLVDIGYQVREYMN